MKRKVMLSSLIAAGILTPLAATGARFSEPVVLHAQSSAPAALDAAPSASQALPDFSCIAQQYGPAVVNISAMVGKSKGTVARLVKRADAQIYIPVELG